MKVFLDANILFSGSQIGSPIRKLLDSLHAHALLLAHPGVIEEARRNISAKKPDWMPGFDSLLGELQISTQICACPETSLPPKDQPVLAAALGSEADILLTGDRQHFGSLFGTTISGMRICSVRQFAEEMAKLGWIPKSQ